jgi:hypothetical protein
VVNSLIYIDRTIIINKNEATIEEPIVLYRGDKNIEIQFTIENNPFKYKAGTAVTYGQLVIIRPNAAAIIPEPAKLSNGKVLFTIEDGMIDEDIELGNYDFQIRMINADQTSRGTLPPVAGGIIIKEPICQEATVNTTYANNKDAIVMPGNDMATYSMRRADDIFDDNGDYNRTNWYGGDIITDTKLNKIEEALYMINNDIPTDYATEMYVEDIDRRTRNYIIDNYATMDYVDHAIETIDVDLIGYATEDYVNDAVGKIESRYAPMDYVTDSINTNNRYIENVILDDYATEEYVDEAIRNVEGGNVDLTGYATEAYVDQVLGDIDSILGGI